MIHEIRIRLSAAGPWLRRAPLLLVPAVLGSAAGLLLGDLELSVLVIGLLVAGATLVIVVWRYDLAAPAAVFGIVWSVAIIGAQYPPFGQPPWDTRMWLLATIPPAALLISAMAVTGPVAIRRPRLGLKVAPANAVLIQLTLAGAVLLGGAVFVVEFLGVGGIPLLSANTDALRFQLLFSPYVHLGTRLIPTAAILSGVAAVATRGRTRMGYLAIVGVALTLDGATGGRLEVLTIVGTVGIATVVGVRISPRSVITIATVAVLALGFSSWLFFDRAAQHPDEPFGQILYNQVLPSRPAALAWTVPLQIGVSGGLYVLNAMVQTNALSNVPGSGLYSLHGLHSLLPAKDSEAVARDVAGALIAPTFLADLYGDFGLVGSTIACLLFGILYALLYRAAVAKPRLSTLVVYSYACFWLAFFPYVDVWTYFFFWPFDILLLWLGAHLLENGGLSSRSVATDMLHVDLGERRVRAASREKARQRW